MPETVNHPQHYNAHPSGVECIDIVEHFDFNVGNAIKYLWRAGLKSDNAVGDLKKAAWYINREIGRLERDTTCRVCGGDGIQDSGVRGKRKCIACDGTGRTP